MVPVKVHALETKPKSDRTLIHLNMYTEEYQMLLFFSCQRLLYYF